MHNKMHLVYLICSTCSSGVGHADRILYATRGHSVHSSLEGLKRLPRNNNTHTIQSAVKCSHMMVLLARTSRNLNKAHEVAS